MRKILLPTFPSAALCVVLPALVVSCSDDSNLDQGATPLSSVTGTNPSQNSSSEEPNTPISTPSSGSSAATSSAGNGGGSDPQVAATTGPSSDAASHTGGSDTAAPSGDLPTSTSGPEGAGGAGGAETAGNDSGGSTSTGGSGGTESSANGGSGTEVNGGGSTSTGDAGTPGTGGAGSTPSDGTLPLDNDPVRSAGCDKADGLDALTSGGMSVSGGLPTSTRLSLNGRDYIIDIPADYDPANPYRLIFSWHQAYGSANGNAVGQYPANNGPNFDAQHYAYFGLQREATAANQPSIFVAPQGVGDFPWDYDRDVVVFDNLLALIDQNLCIDDSRVFTTGFSFGAMMSYALSLGRASKLRAAVTMAAANYNFTQPSGPRMPLAYMGTTGMSDGTCPWVNGNSTTQGGKYCVLQHAEDNGCTIPDDIMTAMVGSKSHVCYDFEGCKAGYPVKVCTFDGNHTPSAVADGSSGGDDGLTAFIPPLAWKFISQF
jgi:predicted esterase